MYTRALRFLAIAVLCNVLLAGCDQKTSFEKFVPKDDDAFARRFLEAVRSGDYQSADAMLDASLRGEKSEDALRDLNTALSHGEPVSIEVVGCNTVNNDSTQPPTRTTNLSYQFHFADSWVAGSILVGHPGGTASILGSRFGPIPDSLGVLNRFTLSGKPFPHYVVLAICLIVPLIILIAIVVCVRSSVRGKWLWLIFILFGFVQFRLDWSSGQMNIQPLSFILGGISIVRFGPYAPWILGFSIPVGAILFLILRRRLLRRNDTKPIGPSEGNV